MLSGKFDPFAPIWLFLVGYVQIYVIQAFSYHEWAVRVRGVDLVATANGRALWALLWFLAIYFSGLGRLVARCLPRPPARWSPGAVGMLSPILIVWGLIGAGMVLMSGSNDAAASPESSLIRSFPFVMLVAGNLLIVTGRSGAGRPVFTAWGMAVAMGYVLIWMFNGKRSHSLMGVLSTICAYYISRMRRPSWPVLISTAFVGALAVSIAIGWRFERDRPRTLSGFVQFLTEFELASILQNVNVEGEGEEKITHETEEYGGYLIMMTACPSLSEYDYGASYLRVFTTFIPRFLWPEKPYYGREQWVSAWIAASEFKRKADFTGPAIGILGATQLNGGAYGTLIVIGCVALFLRTSYDYFRLHAHVPWVQAWWAIFYFNAWMMVVTDDPLVWFYYNWGFTTMPFLALLWFCNKLGAPAAHPHFTPATA